MATKRLITFLALTFALSLAICAASASAAVDALEAESSSSLRDLAIGDFTELNELIKPAILRLADTSVSRDTVSFDVRNLRCTSFQVGDMTVKSNKDTARRVSVPLNIINLDMVCTFDYSYWAALIFSGRGSAKVISSGNDIYSNMAISTTSATLAIRPPNKLVFENCEANVIINDIVFQGGIAAWIANIIEGSLRGRIATMARNKLCQTLDDWSKTTIADQLKNVAETLALYPPRYTVDPLAMERSLVAPDFVKLLNLRGKEGGIAKYVHLALDEAVEYFRGVTYDLDGRVPGPGPTDMNINIFVRNQVLDPNRALKVDVKDMPFLGVNGLLWEGTDRLTKTSIYLNQVKVKGLDTFTKFDPLVYIGDYTVQNKLSWNFLEIEFDATFVIRPSDRKDTVLINPGKKEVVERATLSFRMDDVSALLSLLLAVDSGLLEAVEIGSLLRTNKITPCLLSTIFEVAVSGLSLNLDDIEPPTLVGFVSPGIDRVFSGAMDAAFVVFQDLLLARVPTIFNLAVRNFVNDDILTKYWSYADSKDCSWSSSTESSSTQDGTIDLRDLLLPPDSAAGAGASGLEPYGNLFSSVLVPLLDNKLMPTDDTDGLPLLNDHIVRPITTMQSGSEGTLAFATNLFTIESPSLTSSTSMQLRASNFTMKNLDTISNPVKLLMPTGRKLLNNQVTMGPVARKPLTLSSRLVMSVSGESSPLKMYNDLEIKVSVPSSELMFDVFASIKEDRLLSFPLQDIDNYHCWLDTVLPLVQLANSTDIVEDNSARNALDLSRFFVSLSDIRLSGRCVECSSSGLLALNDILTHIQDAGLSRLLQTRLERLAEEFVWEYWQQMDLERMLSDAPSQCPHSPNFDENTLLQSPSRAVEFGAPSLSLDALETIAGVGALAAETAFVVAAKSHQPGTSFSDPLSSQIAIQSDAKYLDLEDLDQILGGKTMSALTSAHDYLEGEVEDETNGDTDLGLNVLVRRFFLDNEGGFTLPMGMTLNVGGSNFNIDTLRIKGLDSVSAIDTLLEAIGPQTLKSSLTFDRLQVYADIRVEAGPENAVEGLEQETMTLSFALNDVSVDLALLFAADQEKLGLLELGSLMHFDKIPKCLLSRVEGIELTRLVVKATGIDAPQVDGFLSTKFHYDLNSILRSTHEAYYDDIIAGLPQMFDDTVRKVLNEFLGTATRQGVSRDDCDMSSELVDTGYIDFRDLLLTEEASQAQGGLGTSPFGDLLRIVYQNLNSRVLNADSINSYIRSWTKSQSGIEGSAWYRGNVFNSSSSVKIAGFRGLAEVNIADAMVENLDSVVEPLAFIEPVSGQSNELLNIASFGNGEKRFHIAGRATIALSDGDKLNLRNEMDVGLSLTSFSYLLKFFLNIPQHRLYNFPLKDFFNVNCWLAAILSPWEDSPDVPSAGVVDQELRAKGFDIDTSCVSCTSPRFDGLISHLYSPGDDKEDNALLNKATASLFGGGFLKDRLLVEASTHCPHNEAYDPNAKWGESFTSTSATTETEKAEKASRDDKAMWFNSAMAIVTGVVLCLVIAMKVIGRKRHNKWIKSLDDEGFSLFRQQQAKDEDTEKALTASMSSMFRSTAIPRRVRYGVPIAIAADIALFAAGHFAVISAVDLTGHVAGEPFFVENFLSFSFMSSILRTYQNGGNEMAICMLLFSGIYPYVKLIVLGIAWFVPPRLLGGVKRRGSILLWTDVLAKLSVIDIVTMLLLAAVVLVFIGGPTQALSPETSEYYSVEAIVTPYAGFYCFVMAQRISRIGSKYLLEWHHRIVAQATKEHEVKGGMPCAADNTVLSSYSDQSDPSGESKEEEGDEHTHLPAWASNGGGTTTTVTTISSRSSRIEPPLSPSADDGVSTTLISLGWSAGSGEEGGMTLQGQGNALERPQSIRRADSLATEASDMSQRGRGCIRRLSRIGGAAGVVFSAITVCSVFIIGIAIGPSIKLDTRFLWSLALDSGKTFAQAIQSSFFRVISMVLLQARFLMQSSRGDYVGLLILFCLVGISSVLFPFTQAVIKFGKWQRERRRRKRNGLPKKRKRKMPPYIRRLYLWRGIDVYLISFIIALWQLGAVSAYAIHLYCTLLEKLYSSLSYVGLAESSEAQCFRIQASLPMTIFIICASFAFLSVSFYFQASGHYKSNTRRVEAMIQIDLEKERSFRRGLSSTARSSSFWNLDARSQLIANNDDDEDDENVSGSSTRSNRPIADDEGANAETESGFMNGNAHESPA